MDVRAVLLALCLVACGQGERSKGAEPPDPMNLNIEIGRYGVMLDQVNEQTTERPGAAEPEVDDPHQLARRLRETVWRYNLQRSQLCAKGLFTDLACGPPYLPVWISEPDSVTPALHDLQTRADDAGAEVMRLWNAVCEDARARAAEDERMYVCAIE